jgi:hypothetical protein
MAVAKAEAQMNTARTLWTPAAKPALFAPDDDRQAALRIPHVVGSKHCEIGCVAQFHLERNVIDLAPSPDGVLQPVAILFDDAGQPTEPPPYAFGKIVIRENTIVGTAGSLPGLACVVAGATELMLRENRVDSGAEQPLQDTRCQSVRYVNNRTPGGDLLRRYDNGRWVEEWDAEADEALVMSMFKP